MTAREVRRTPAPERNHPGRRPVPDEHDPQAQRKRRFTFQAGPVDVLEDRFLVSQAGSRNTLLNIKAHAGLTIIPFQFNDRHPVFIEINLGVADRFP